MIDKSCKEQQTNAVDDTILRAVLSSLMEIQMHAFLERFNRADKAGKSTTKVLQSNRTQCNSF